MLYISDVYLWSTKTLATLWLLRTWFTKTIIRARVVLVYAGPCTEMYTYRMSNVICHSNKCRKINNSYLKSPQTVIYLWDL